jgi:uncharacterized surface protein with fasciclin (FAS1) repeats
MKQLIHLFGSFWKNELTMLLLSHIALELIYTPNVLKIKLPIVIPTLASPITITRKQDGTIYVEDAMLVVGDVIGSNGVLHGIDTVLNFGFDQQDYENEDWYHVLANILP